MKRVVAWASVALALGCQPEVPSGVYVCSFDGDCPPEMTCQNRRCVSGCVPDACVAPRCGTLDDGCGGTLECGDETCTGLDTCGAVYDNVCGCAPIESCAEDQCGVIDNGCGASVNCGLCGEGQLCDDETNRCVACVPPTCAANECGMKVNPCGGDPIECGFDCGSIGQDCGPENTCVDDCVPVEVVCEPGQCWQVPDGCGDVVRCGSCSGIEECNMDTMPGQCECPRNCQPSAECGTLRIDGCRDMECGGCEGTRSCVDNQCSCPNDAHEPNDTVEAAVTWQWVGAQAPLQGLIANELDDDWYVVARPDMTDPTNGLHRVVVTLTPPPGLTGDIYHLEVFSDEAREECVGRGTEVVAPTGDQGCLDGVGPGIERSVRMRTAGAPSKILIHVDPQLADQCILYELTLDVQPDVEPPSPG